jgi:hypothetical protein
MGRLTNLRHEAFCQLVEVLGWSKTDSYEAVGFKRDRANAVKFSEREDIAARRRELQVEREALKTMNGETALRKILEGAMHSGDWSPAATAARTIAEHDQSLRKLGEGSEFTAEEIRRRIEKLPPVQALGSRMIFSRDSFEPVPDSDIGPAERGLVIWFNGRQVSELASRLIAGAGKR